MRICLITPGQPSSNPRLVKEGDALAEAGHSVHAICADCGLWPSRMDGEEMARRPWTYSYAAGSARSLPGLVRRLRHKLARTVSAGIGSDGSLAPAAISPVAPELLTAAMRFPAEMYIAHHLVALPAAVGAARKFNARVGYDIEDIYTAMRPLTERPSSLDRLMKRVECRYIPSCDYVTSAAPTYTRAYEEAYGVAPTPILNVFPLSERPQAFRPGDSGQPLRIYWFSQCIGEKRGLEDAIRALGLLRECGVELHLRGNWKTGYEKSMKALASSVGADWNKVKSYPPAPPHEMARLAAQFDVGLAIDPPADPNRDLCLTNKLFVYLLSGNAVVASDTNGQRAITNELGTAAFSYKSGDFHTLAAGIRNWHLDRGELESARRRAWEWGSRRYNWDIEKTRFVRLVEDTLDSREPCRASHGQE